MLANSLKILVVEDNSVDCTMLTRSLKKTLTSPPDCCIVERLAAAINLLEESVFDLVVTDLNLPDSSGLETFSKLKSAAQQTPIVVLSGVEDVELAIHAMRLGAQDYLVKGGRPEVLGRILRFAVERSRRVTAERSLKKAEEELDLAREIQQTLYPKTGPGIEGFDIAGSVYSAEQACGDYFDFIKRPDGKCSIVLGDVAGHGLPAALCMLQVRACLQLLAAQNCPISDAISYVNNTIVNPFSDSFRFMTLFCMTLDPTKNELEFAGAGHQGYLIHADNSIEILESTGLATGILKDVEPPQTRVIQLAKGDIVFVPTDGFEEASARDSGLFGKERLLDLVVASRERESKGIIQALFETVQDFSDAVAQDDDMTAIMIKVCS